MTTPQFYLAQTSFSDPGTYAPLYDALPDDLDGLCRTVRGIYRHYMDEPNPTPERSRVGDAAALVALYEASPQLHVPDELTCYSPTGDWQTVRPQYTL